MSGSGSRKGCKPFCLIPITNLLNYKECESSPNGSRSDGAAGIFQMINSFVYLLGIWKVLLISVQKVYKSHFTSDLESDWPVLVHCKGNSFPYFGYTFGR